MIFRKVYISKKICDSIAALTAFARYPWERIATSSFWGFQENKHIVGWLRLKKVLKPANHSTNISFGRKLLYNHIKHLKGGHTLSLPIFSPICIN